MAAVIASVPLENRYLSGGW